MFEGKRNALHYKWEMERIYIRLTTEELKAIRDRTLKTASNASKEEVDRREESAKFRNFLDMSIIELNVIDKIITSRKICDLEIERNRLAKAIEKHKNKRPRRFI